MKIITVLGCVALGGLLVGCGRDSDNTGASSVEPDNSMVGRGSSSDVNSPSTVPPDNTGRNVRDRSDATLTPMDQGNNKADLETTARIRRLIADDDQLSANAKNLKVITVNGKVTVRGPVEDAQEMSAVQSLLQQAGVGSFENQMEVKPADDK